jgi:hypothetical protein
MKIKRAIEQKDPERFGVQPNGSYMPGPAEIARHCKIIRESESPKQLQTRAEWAYSSPLIVREVSDK